MTLPELTVAAAILSLLVGSLMISVVTLQRSFAASQEHAKSQLEQARFLDYVGRDLRRALAVFPEETRISMTIPEFYNKYDNTRPTPNPLTPTIRRGYADYGPNPRVIRYYKKGSTLVRRDHGVETVIATDVADFQLKFEKETGQQVVNVSVTFVPRFQIAANADAVRQGTTASADFLLRNKRIGATVPDTP